MRSNICVSLQRSSTSSWSETCCWVQRSTWSCTTRPSSSTWTQVRGRPAPAPAPWCCSLCWIKNDVNCWSASLDRNGTPQPLWQHHLGSPQKLQSKVPSGSNRLREWHNILMEIQSHQRKSVWCVYSQKEACVVLWWFAVRDGWRCSEQMECLFVCLFVCVEILDANDAFSNWNKWMMIPQEKL